MDLKKEVVAVAQSAREASRYAAALSSEAKNKALKDMAGALLNAKAAILKLIKKT